MVNFIHNGRKYAVKSKELASVLLALASEKPVLRYRLILENVSRETI